MENLITKENVKAAADDIAAAAPGFVPELAIILGSGMGDLAESIQDSVTVPYTDVAHMVPATVQGHKGEFVLGTLEGRKVVCMRGRLHAYEGNSAQQIAFPVYVANRLGAKQLIITNAAGGIDPSYSVGDLMFIQDHINFQMMNPVMGPVPELGPRFFDMTHPYSLRLLELAKQAAATCSVKVHQGTYIGDLGPSFETPAEIRAFRAMGADAVGMSTVQEVIAANQLGMEVLAISLISNPAAGVCDEPLSIEDVAKAAHVAAGNIAELIRTVLPNI